MYLRINTIQSLLDIQLQLIGSLRLRFQQRLGALRLGLLDVQGHLNPREAGTVRHRHPWVGGQLLKQLCDTRLGPPKGLKRSAVAWSRAGLVGEPGL